ncbi:MAG: type II secretion system secretin GspD [Deltaproteobacteria bacterium]|nr:type II secretion system secretin GspD [Deltaproteobacteria bacterium]
MRRLALLVPMVLVPSIARAETAGAQVEESAELYSCKTNPSDVVMSFKPDMEIKDLVAWAIGFTCKPFMLAPNVVATGRKVTLIAPQKMTRTEAYSMFLAALSTVGLTVVPKGKGYRIVESATAKTQPLPLYNKTAPADNDQLVRYVVRPSFTRAETLQKAFMTMRSDAGDVQILGSIVLVTDYGSSVRAMMQLGKLIDVPEGTDAIYTLQLKHAEASKLMPKLEGMLGIAAGPGAKPGAETAQSTGSLAVPSKLMVDERTNTLIIAGTEAAFQRVQALVDRLDIALDIEGGASIHVYKLSHGIAPDLAAVLTAVVQGPGKTAPASGQAAGPQPSVPLDTKEPRVSGEVRVIAEAASNSLIVLSSGRDFLAIKEIIKQLDEPRRQVYIEGMIVEVQLSNDQETGVSAHGFLPGSGSSVLLGGLQQGNNGTSSLDVKSLANSTGLVTGVLSSATTTIMGTTIPSYGALLTAIATKTNSNVMSLPSIIAVDNQLTHLTIGTNIPYKRGVSYGGLNGTTPTGSTTVNIEREPLELKLDIKPHISPDGSVLLEIDHAAKELGETGGELGPTWTTRELKGQVVVPDQQTVVIGGLISTKEYVSKSQIPILGDIPVLGGLFRHTYKQKRKSNMVILLTPYIVRDQLDIEAIRAKRMAQTQEFMRSFSTLESMKYQPKIDYARKRGLIEEINRSVQSVEEDRAALEELRKPRAIKEGAI